jgi:hypothetical protein
MAGVKRTMHGTGQRQVESLYDRYNDSYPEDEHEPPKPWECIRCKTKYIDPEEYRWADIANYNTRVEVKSHWLGPTEIICEECAVKAGIPDVDTD